MKRILNSGLIGMIPLFILIFSAIYLVWLVSTSNILLQNKHIARLIFVALATIAFFILYKPAILFLGLTMILGLCGLISLSPSISIVSIYIGPLGISFQPIFLLWIVIHFMLSGKYYVGLLTKEYWKMIRSKALLSIDDYHSFKE